MFFCQTIGWILSRKIICPLVLNSAEKENGIVVYMLQCIDGTLYTGWTNHLEKRLAAHNAGRGAKYTRSRRPVHLVYQEAQPDRSAALRREAEIKRLTRLQKLALIHGRPLD